MSNVVDFKPKGNLEAIEQLKEFIEWAQATLPKGIPNRVHPNIRWEMNSWGQSGLVGTCFSVFGEKQNMAERRYMKPAFMDFAKAIIVYRCVFKGKKSTGEWLASLKALEAALLELTGAVDVTQVTAAVSNRACWLLQQQRPIGSSAYKTSKSLERIIGLMVEKKLLANPIRWSSPLKAEKVGILKKQKKDQEKKLPSRDSLLALAELFNNNLSSPLDIVVTSACALLLSQPSRVGELAQVEHDCIVFKGDEQSGRRMFLRWYAEKGFGATLKPVVVGMELVVERLVERMLMLSEEPRAYAAWLEDHPDEFPPHAGLPDKGPDDSLSYVEACAAIKIKLGDNTNDARIRFRKSLIDTLAKRNAVSPAARVVLDEIKNGWDKSRGVPVFGEGRGTKKFEFDDAVITLRKLNVLVREKYLPIDFPYTTPPQDGVARVKYRDALFTVRTGALSHKNGFGCKLADFGVEVGANVGRMTVQLGGGGNTKSIFERHGYGDVRVSTHAFRHELNTEMHRAGLSQLLIDAFSGRTSMGSVYNHETVEERTQAVAAVHPKTKQSNVENRLEKIRTNEPLSLSDVTELVEGSQDRVIHQTHVGLCVHNFASEPCPKMGSCLSCGNLACVKGDEEKLKNLKEERSYLQKRCSDALRAKSEGVFGASEWVTKVRNDLLKCDALIRLLENPNLENGAIVWNADNGWNLTNNAAAMAGLVDPQVIEANAHEALASLDELSAMMDEIEV